MLSGTVPMLTAEANLVKQYGLHAVAVFAEQRSPDFPETPTMREQGLDLVYPLWTGIFTAPGTPEALVARMDEACARTLRTPSVIEGMTRAGHPIRYLNHQAFTAYVKAEASKYEGLIRDSGLQQAQ
jgi:tripartite-type tricarboxylate transporter receptor subunit TctC